MLKVTVMIAVTGVCIKTYHQCLLDLIHQWEHYMFVVIDQCIRVVEKNQVGIKHTMEELVPVALVMDLQDLVDLVLTYLVAVAAVVPKVDLE